MEDVYFTILTYLPLNDIFHCMLVDKTFYRSSRNPLLWSKLLNGQYKEIKEETLYETYKTGYQLTKIMNYSQVKYKNLDELFKLQKLYLSENQLTTIPSELGQLCNLRTLYLHYNQLTTIPSELGQLTNLQTLYLKNNQLTTIPNEIKQLNIPYKDF